MNSGGAEEAGAYVISCLPHQKNVISYGRTQ